MSSKSKWKIFAWRYPRGSWNDFRNKLGGRKFPAPLSKDKENPLISVIVPAFNEEAILASCLESLQNQKTSTPYEILVVDNASSDGTGRVAEDMGIPVIRENHRGLTHARQAGFQAARGKLIAYLDADSLAEPNWIETIALAYRSYPEAVAFRGPYRLILESWWQKILFEIYFNLGVEFFYGLCLRRAIIAGTNFAVPKTVLEKIGGFNLDIEFYGEDMDLANRLKRLGPIQFFDSLILSSGRRFDHKGLLKPAFYYLGNYLWLTLFKKPFSRHYDQADGDAHYLKETVEMPSEIEPANTRFAPTK